MTARPPTLHGTCVSLGRDAAVLRGAPGAGKSDLALRFITAYADRGARLIGDDQLVLKRRDNEIWASAPPGLAGLLEVRGVGIIQVAHLAEARVSLLVDLVAGDAVPRMPPDSPPLEQVSAVALPIFKLCPFEASAPEKLLLLLTGEAAAPVA